MRTALMIAVAMAALLTSSVEGVQAADDQQFVPLQTFIGQQSENDPFSSAYVATRCSSLYIIVAALLDGDKDPKRQQLKTTLAENAVNFQLVAIRLRMSARTTKLEDETKNLDAQSMIIAKLYSERIQQGQARSGSIFSDALVADDLKICGSLKVGGEPRP